MARSSNTNARVRVTADTRQAQRQVGGLRRTMRNASTNIFNDWKRMALGIGGVATAIQGASTVLRDFEATQRNLIVGTGASGGGLRQLFDVTGQVASRVGIGLDAVSSLVAELDTTFPELRRQSRTTFAEIAEDTAQLDFLFGQGFGSRAIRTFRAFTDDIDESRRAFDLLADLGTKTPGGLEPVIAFLDRYSARLERFNFGLDESLFLLSSLRRENINLRTFGTGLSIFAQRAVEEGRDPRERLFEVIELVDSFTTSQDRNNAAIEYFGAEASSAWLAAIDAGVLSLEGLDQALIDSAGTLDDLEARTTTATSLMSQAWSSFSSEVGKAVQSTIDGAQESGINLDRAAERLGRYAATAGATALGLGDYSLLGVGGRVAQRFRDTGGGLTYPTQGTNPLIGPTLNITVDATELDTEERIYRGISRALRISGVGPGFVR